MNRDFYTNIRFSPSNNAYLFMSEGRHGIIPKIVIFQRLTEPNAYNLFLGDYIDNQVSDDRQVTNNGDLPKVMATVIEIVRRFAADHPRCRIIVSGSNAVRKRLYARIVFGNYAEIIRDFEVQCANSLNEPYRNCIPADRFHEPYAFLFIKK